MPGGIFRSGNRMLVHARHREERTGIRTASPGCRRRPQHLSDFEVRGGTKKRPLKGRFLKEAKREGTVLRRILDAAPRGGGSHVKLKRLARNFHVIVASLLPRWMRHLARRSKKSLFLSQDSNSHPMNTLAIPIHPIEATENWQKRSRVSPALGLPREKAGAWPALLRNPRNRARRG